jgi:hypothetical protein
MLNERHDHLLLIEPAYNDLTTGAIRTRSDVGNPTRAQTELTRVVACTDKWKPCSRKSTMDRFARWALQPFYFPGVL